MGTAGRYWRTVRYLKPQQIVARVLFRLSKPRAEVRPAPPLRARAGNWVLPARREPSLVAPLRLKLLNVERALDDGGWDDRRVDRLWRYNLHYFDDLNARDAEERRPWQRELLNRWLAENAPGHGTGWEPYPVSLRIANMIKGFLSGMTPEAAWLDSLAAQARWLRRRLEWHLLGNHLLANAKALVFAGSFFDSDEADEWLRCGSDILRRQIKEQILPDGGHFERSPMYHALCLEDFLDILNLTAALSPPRVSPRDRNAVASSANRMLYWLRCMHHADDTLASFNDSAQGVCPHLDELERYAAAIGVVAEHPPHEGIVVLRDSGYVRAARGTAVALLDVAPIGPDYLPGHAHADTLSFELSLGKQRIVVNGGTSSYGVSAVRQRERGTGAHSTVQIAEADSSEVWGSFRVGRRARPSTPIVTEWEVCCSHDGYRFLPGKPEHRRCWRLDPAALTVKDTVAPPTVGAVARYLLAPGLRLDRVSAARWNVLGARGQVAHVEVLQGHAEARKAQHAPQFGVTLPVDCLAITLVDGAAASCWHWADNAHFIPDR